MPYTQKTKLMLAVGLVPVTIVLLLASLRAVESAPLWEKLQDKEKRDLITREFKNMPLKFNAIRNKDSETWYKDLQIEVKNIGAKPIYHILTYLDFPDHKSAGRDTGIFLTFGELKYVDVGVVADPKDMHLDPGQTYVFTIPEKMAKGLGRQYEEWPEDFRRLDFHFGVISFGDRTGFEAGGSPVDLRNTKN